MTAAQTASRNTALLSALSGTEIALHALDHAAQIQHEAGDAPDAAAATDAVALQVIASRLRVAFGIRARSVGRETHLTARAPRTSFNDLGEGIHQTLLGDLTLDGWGSCSGRAGLEIRGDLIPAAWGPQ